MAGPEKGPNIWVDGFLTGSWSLGMVADHRLLTLTVPPSSGPVACMVKSPCRGRESAVRAGPVVVASASGAVDVVAAAAGLMAAAAAGMLAAAEVLAAVAAAAGLLAAAG